MSECVVRMDRVPKNCDDGCWGSLSGECPWCGSIDGYKMVGNRPPNCPIIAVLPEGHGRFIDADAFEKDISDALVCGLKEITSEEGKQIFHVLMQEVLDNVKKRKNIVPAERSKT